MPAPDSPDNSAARRAAEAAAALAATPVAPDSPETSPPAADVGALPPVPEPPLPAPAVTQTAPVSAAADIPASAIPDPAEPIVVRSSPPPVAPRPSFARVDDGGAFQPGAMPEPVSLASVPLHGTYYRARLAEYPSRMDATQGWLEMARRAPELHGAVEIVAERTALTTTHLRYTLVTAPVADRAPVEKMCATLEARGIVCRVEAAGSDAALSPRG